MEPLQGVCHETIHTASEDQLSIVGKIVRKMKASESPSLSADLYTLAPINENTTVFHDTLKPKQKDQEKEMFMEAAITVFGDAIHKSFKFLRGPLYTGEWSSEYETLMSVEELGDEWDAFQKSKRIHDTSISEHTESPQKVSRKLSESQVQQLQRIPEQRGQAKKKPQLSLGNSNQDFTYRVSPALHYEEPLAASETRNTILASNIETGTLSAKEANQVKEVNLPNRTIASLQTNPKPLVARDYGPQQRSPSRDSQARLKTQKGGTNVAKPAAVYDNSIQTLFPNNNRMTGKIVHCTAHQTTKPKENVQHAILGKPQPETTPAIDKATFDESEAFSNNPDFMYLPGQQLNFPREYNSEIDILPLFPDDTCYGIGPSSFGVEALNHNQMRSDNNRSNLDTNINHFSCSSAVVNAVGHDGLDNNATGSPLPSLFPHGIHPCSLYSQYSNFLPASQDISEVSSALQRNSQSHTPQPYQGISSIAQPLLHHGQPSHWSLQNNQYAHPSFQDPQYYSRNGMSDGLELAKSCRENMISEHTIYPPISQKYQLDQYAPFTQSVKSTNDMYGSVTFSHQRFQKQRRGSRQQKRKLPSEVVDLSNRIVSNPMNKHDSSQPSGNTTISQDLGGSKPFEKTGNRASSPIKFHLPRPVDKKIKRELVMIQFDDPKQRERAVTLLEDVTKSEGRDIKVVENFKSDSTTLSANGQIGSNTRGFVQSIFPSSQVLEFMN